MYISYVSTLAHFPHTGTTCRQSYRQQLRDYCHTPELRHGKKYKYLQNFPTGTLIPLYLTHDKNKKYISMVIIVPLHFGYVKGDCCSSREEAEETAAKTMLDKLRQY